MKRISHDEHGRALFDRRIEGALQILILCNLLSFAVETLPNLSAALVACLHSFEILCAIVFSIEYILRIRHSKSSRAYICSFMGIIDLISILPFYLNIAFDLSNLRAVKLIRVFRIFKLIRYSAAARRYHLAFHYAKEELILFGAAALIVLYLTAVGIHYFEGEAQPKVYSSVFHSLWWSIVTLTTVGYGDVMPITAGGRIFTGIVLIVGVGLVAVPTGLVATALSKARDHDEQQRKKNNIM